MEVTSQMMTIEAQAGEEYGGYRGMGGGAGGSGANEVGKPVTCE